jgi:hypothetical protein
MAPLAKINPVLPVSHQFDHFSDDFREKFSCFEFRSADHVEGWAGDALVHTGLSLTMPDFASQIDFDNLRKAPVRRFSFDVGPCFREVETVDTRYVGVGEKLSVDQVLSIAKTNLESVREKFPANCELAFENLNYYPTGAYDGVCDAEFCNRACSELDLKMVLDVAHARVTAANLGYKFSVFLNQLDLNNVNEVHLSRPEINNDKLSMDRHEQPDDEEFSWLKVILDRIGNARSKPVDVVIEYYRDIDGIMASYERLQKEFCQQ